MGGGLFVLFLLWHLFFYFHFRLLQHVPFRESKLTHYLQSFFCGRGKVCMIVNINQCASMYDETLNVLKFSAVAQKVCSQCFFAEMIKKWQFDPWMMTQKITSDLNRCLKAIPCFLPGGDSVFKATSYHVPKLCQWNDLYWLWEKEEDSQWHQHDEQHSWLLQQSGGCPGKAESFFLPLHSLEVALLKPFFFLCRRMMNMRMERV